MKYPRKVGIAIDQLANAVAGGAEPKLKPASIDKWVRYAEKQKRDVHIIVFLWRSPAAHLGLVGIADQPELREQYLAVGRRVI